MASGASGQIRTAELSLSDQKKFWLGHNQRYQASGLSMVAYARSQGLVVNTFYGWHFKLKKRQVIGAEPAAAVFHQVKIEPGDPIQPSGVVSLRFRLPNGIDCELQSADLNSCCQLLDMIVRHRP